MSDTALNQFFQYGTNAQRLAFTPSPAAGIKPLYEWYETDTDTTWVYTTGWHQISSVGSANTGLVLLEQHTASASASLDFTTAITASYDEYVFELISLVPASNSDLKMLVSSNGGSTWDTSNVYRWQNLSAWSAGTGQNSGGVATSWLLRGSNTTLISGGAYNGTLKFFNPRSTTLNKVVKGSLPIDDNTLGLVIFEWLGTWRTTGTAINALQFSMASGNITSGTIRCYGCTK